MIRFALVSSNNINIGKFGNIIDRLLMNNNIYYETSVFDGNNKNFDDFCSNAYGSMVFIVENDGKININDILDKIRNVYKNHTAFIILIDGDKKLDFHEIMSNYFFMCQIIEEVNFEMKLKNILSYIIDIIYSKKNVLTFIYEKSLYKIPYDDILYIEKELNGKKCMIVCAHKTYVTYKSLLEISKELDERFTRSHQSALINLRNVKEIDFLNNRIIFNDKIQCTLLSRNMKKNLKLMILNK